MALDSATKPITALGNDRPPVLPDAEVTRRLALLTELQTSLAALGVRSVLAKTRRLVLRSGQAPYEPSGPTNPQLHILTDEGTRVVTTDGATYHLTNAQPHPATDPAAAAAHISRIPAARP